MFYNYKVILRKIDTSCFPNPDKCVVCGKFCGEEKIRIRGGLGDLGGRLKVILTGFPKIWVPGHLSCQKGFNKRELTHGVLLVLILTIILSCFFIFCGAFNRFYVILSLFMLVPIDRLFLRKFWREIPFHFFKKNDKYIFYFQDIRYGEKFFELNQGNLYQEDIFKNLKVKK